MSLCFNGTGSRLMQLPDIRSRSVCLGNVNVWGHCGGCMHVLSLCHRALDSVNVTEISLTHTNSAKSNLDCHSLKSNPANFQSFTRGMLVLLQRIYSTSRRNEKKWKRDVFRLGRHANSIHDASGCSQTKTKDVQKITNHLHVDVADLWFIAANFWIFGLQDNQRDRPSQWSLVDTEDS